MRGGGRGQGPSWKAERTNPIDPQVAIIAPTIGLAMADNGRREANCNGIYYYRYYSLL